MHLFYVLVSWQSVGEIKSIYSYVILTVVHANISKSLKRMLMLELVKQPLSHLAPGLIVASTSL